MPYSPTSVYLQPIVITSGPEPHEISAHDDLQRNISGSYPLTKQLDPGVAGPVTLVPKPERQILRQTFSNVPIISQSELSRSTKELGEALTEMIEFDEDEEWKIEAPVFHAARYVAALLRDRSYPAPRLFNHGPKSVVFNWSLGTDNLYLTVSADKMSALVSSPERIKRRIDYSANESLDSVLILFAIQDAPRDGLSY